MREYLAGDRVWVLLEDDRLIPATYKETVYDFDLEGYLTVSIRVDTNTPREYVGLHQVFPTKGRAKWYREFYG